MRIILSRKGFDSSIQGGGSANIVYENEIFPIPIPEVGNGITYDKLVFKNDVSYLDVMRDLNINQFTECHFDPYLSTKLLPKDSTIRYWKKSLGQCNGSQSTLKLYNIKKDDIFIFFGWFNKVEIKKDKYRYTQFDNYNKEGVHMIYGYLQVGDEIINIKTTDVDRSDWVGSHPHFKQRKYYRGDNVIYTANRYFSLNKSKPGGGLFNFSKNLILTEEMELRSNWILPEIFHPSRQVKINFLPENKWGRIEDNKTSVSVRGRGQEFVVIEDPNKKIQQWAIDLINNHDVVI